MYLAQTPHRTAWYSKSHQIYTVLFCCGETIIYLRSISCIYQYLLGLHHWHWVIVRLVQNPNKNDEQIRMKIRCILWTSNILLCQISILHQISVSGWDSDTLHAHLTSGLPGLYVVNGSGTLSCLQPIWMLKLSEILKKLIFEFQWQFWQTFNYWCRRYHCVNANDLYIVANENQWLHVYILRQWLADIWWQCYKLRWLYLFPDHVFNKID